MFTAKIGQIKFLVTFGLFYLSNIHSGRLFADTDSIHAPLLADEMACNGAAYPMPIDPLTEIPDIQLFGGQLNAYFGLSVASAGDVNADGFEDVIVGAYKYDNGQTDEGRAYIYHGSASGLNTSPSTILEVNQAFAYFGYSVSGAGDVNNDGYDDVIVGAYSYDNGQTNEGRAYVFHGSATGISTSPAATMESNQASAGFGIAVSNAGDVNADGYDDVIVGAYLYDNGQTDEGRAYIFHGSVSGINTIPVTTLEINQASAIFGTFVSGAGDVNNDGFDDVIISAVSYEAIWSINVGSAYVYHGSPSGIATSPASVFVGNEENANFGSSVSRAGDVNGDGFDDVIIGSEYLDFGPFSSCGAAFVYQGSSTGLVPTPLTVIYGDNSSDNFGTCVSYAGDVNGDGFSDVLVGGNLAANTVISEGMAYLFLGSSTGPDTMSYLTMSGNQYQAEFGFRLSGAGDVNGDGLSDLIIGAYKADNVFVNEGSVSVYYGGTCSEIYYADVDADFYGNADALVVACNQPYGFVQNTEDCYDLDPLVYPGPWFDLPDGLDNDCNGIAEDNPIAEQVLTIAPTGSVYGRAIGGGGDFNGDGFADLVVGAKWYDNVVVDRGRADIYHGSLTGITTSPAATIEGFDWYGEMGTDVANAGDVNGDGYDDVIIGGATTSYGQFEEGVALVFYGSNTGIVATLADTLQRNQANAHFGASVSGVGDINGDGYDDVVVGAHLWDNGQTNEGAAFLYLGSESGINTIPHVTIESNLANADLGNDVSPAGDVNGDGYDDVLICAHNYDLLDEGRVYIFLGSPTGLNILSPIILEFNISYMKFGSSGDCAGDVNGDGFDDVIIGSEDYATVDGVMTLGPGRADIFLGTSTGVELTPASTLWMPLVGGNLGHSVAGLGDINMDGYDDVITGAYHYSHPESNEGMVFVFLGEPTGVSEHPWMYFESNGTNRDMGQAVTYGGNIDNSGSNELVFSSKDSVFVISLPCQQYYQDLDADGYGNNAVSAYFCETPDPGYVTDNTDCNDAITTIYPGSTETCNLLDDDCDALIDEGAAPVITIAAAGPTTFCSGSSVLLTATHTGASVQWKKNGTNIPGAISMSYIASTTGNYSCQSTNMCGVTLSSTITVTANKNPNANITAGGATTFCAGGSVVLTANAGAGLSYQWYKGATAIAGATSISYTATTSGNYKCRVTKIATGCFKNSNTIVVSVVCREEEIETSYILLDVQPNPATTELFITCSVNINTAQLYNELGQLIMEISVSDGYAQADISTLSAGMYFLRAGGEVVQWVKQ